MPKLLPSRTKYRKVQKGRLRGKAQRGATLAFGTFGIQSLRGGYMTSSQIEAARIAITRHLKRKGKVWIRVFPQKSYTKKPLEVRMGKGKANVEGWVAVVRPGRILYEVAGVPEETAREAMRLAAHKLPIKVQSPQKSIYSISIYFKPIIRPKN